MSKHRTDTAKTKQETVYDDVEAVVVRGTIPLNFVTKECAQAKAVLLGEASHGTREFYTERASISKALIKQHGFRLIAVEGDWPSCFAVNKYIKGNSEYSDSRALLRAVFTRWPQWMWANEETAEFIEWLRAHNRGLRPEEQVGFYGLDVYSLWDSLNELDERFRGNTELHVRLRELQNCFEPFQDDEFAYARATSFLDTTCQQEAVAFLAAVLRERPQDGFESELSSVVNALVVKNAERYYRIMMSADEESWNVRDQHMDQVLSLLQESFAGARAIVWAHNTHVGDARSTDMNAAGLTNIGSLVRDRLGLRNVRVIGFGTYAGNVIAGKGWGEPLRKMTIPPAKEHSWESVLHDRYGEDVLLSFPRSRYPIPLRLPARALSQRAVGVVYHPDAEYGNYVPTDLPSRYDFFRYIETTSALQPLGSAHPEPELETYPSGE